MVEPGAIVKLQPIAVDHDRVGRGRREPPEFRIDQAKAADHFGHVLVRTVPPENMVFDGVRAGGEDDDTVRTPRVALCGHPAQRLVVLRRILGDVRLECDSGALAEDHLAGPVML